MFFLFYFACYDGNRAGIWNILSIASRKKLETSHWVFITQGHPYLVVKGYPQIKWNKTQGIDSGGCFSLCLCSSLQLVPVITCPACPQNVNDVFRIWSECRNAIFPLRTTHWFSAGFWLFGLQSWLTSRHICGHVGHLEAWSSRWF